MRVITYAAGLLIGIALLSMIGWVVYMALQTSKPIETRQITSGKILTCPVSRHADQIGFSYGFEKNGHTKVTITFRYAGELTMSDCKEHFIGRSFPIIYDSALSGNNDILIDSISFRKYNIPFPDSLKWIYNYIRGQDDPGT